MLTNYSSFILKESTGYNSTMCPYAWDGDVLKERIRKKLLGIAGDFIQGISILSGATIADIILTGSLTNYNWTEQSDFDLHIRVDMESLGDDVELLNNYFIDEKTLWNMRHNITLKGFPVEIYIEDASNEHVTEYSLTRNEWVKRPVKGKPSFDQGFVDKKVNDYISLINYYERESNSVLTNQQASEMREDVSAMWDSITKNRRTELQRTHDEYNEYNLIFKKLRNLGYLEKVYNMLNKLYDASYVQ